MSVDKFFNLEGRHVVITGVGLKPLRYVHKDKQGIPMHLLVPILGGQCKANIGAACGFVLAQAGATVYLVGRNTENLAGIKRWIATRGGDKDKIFPITANLADPQETEHLVKLMPGANHQLDWVHSVGVGGGTVTVAGDNPYLRLEEIDSDLVEAELSVLQMTIDLFQALLPRFREQKVTRICNISSMSAVRSVPSGSVHNAAKAALNQFMNAQMIEQAPQGIAITNIRPGGVDTGLYDSPEIRERVVEIAHSYNYDWTDENGGLKLMSPLEVARQVLAALCCTTGHVTSTNIVGWGQWPHEGS